MPKFTVYATITYDLRTEIKADSLEEAQEIADKDLITLDFEQMNGDFDLVDVVEVQGGVEVPPVVRYCIL